jgi:hypothetical protein
VHPEVSGESGVVGKAPQGGRSAKISAQGAAAGAAAAAGSQKEQWQDPPGAPPRRERSSDAVRRLECILEDLQEQVKQLEFETGEEGLIAVRGRILIVEQDAIRQESGRAAASSAAFEGLVAGVQRAGSRVLREQEQLKARIGKQARRIQALESRVQVLESEHSSAFGRKIERIQSVQVEQSEAFDRNIERVQVILQEVLAKQFESRFQAGEKSIESIARGVRQCKALVGLEKIPEEEVQELERRVAKRRKHNPE